MNRYRDIIRKKRVKQPKKTYCSCESAETTDIAKNKDGEYYHILCKKLI